jgi:hypothetical protein
MFLPIDISGAMRMSCGTSVMPLSPGFWESRSVFRAHQQ